MTNKAKVINITESTLYNWDDYYLEGAKVLRDNKPFHIDVTVSSKKRNNRRALNLDIFTEAGSPPLKYIAHMVPYQRKYEVFADLSDKQQKWDKWDTIKQSYTDRKQDDVQYGKCQHRTKHTKILSRKIVPHCAAGIYMQGNDMIAHVLLFDKEYHITCTHQDLSEKGKMFYMARGYHTETLNPDTLDIDV